MTTFLTREQGHWERLAAHDPMWVILTEPGKQGSWDEQEFFQSGRDEIARTFAFLDERFHLKPRLGTALDFGCGIGRLTQALGERFEHVHGVDISPTMVATAATKNRFPSRVSYHANASDRLPMIETGSVDFLYSRLTLQHIPRRAAASYIQEFGRVLSPCGIAVFQTMVRARRWTVRVRHGLRDAMPELYRWLRDQVSRRARWEMNVLPDRAVRRAIENGGMELAGSFDDDSSGAEFESRCFIVMRRPAAQLSTT